MKAKQSQRKKNSYPSKSLQQADTVLCSRLIYQKPLFLSYAEMLHRLNDFWRNCPIENQNDDDDPNYFSGAIKYGVHTLLMAYPLIKVLFLNLQHMNGAYIDSGGIGWIYPEPASQTANKTSVLPPPAARSCFLTER